MQKKFKEGRGELKVTVSFLMFLYATSEMFSMFREVRREACAIECVRYELDPFFWWAVAMIAFTIFLLTATKELKR